MKSGPLATLFLLILSFGLACGKDTLAPVGSVSLEPAALELPYGLWADTLLHWQMDADPESLQGDLMVFVHLLDREGQVQMTLDHPFPGVWQAGKSVEDPLTLVHSSLGPRLPPGQYRLTVGLFDPVTEHRFALAGATDVHRQEYEVGTVTIPETDAQAPPASFSESWRPVELGRDRQVLARRWLVGSGKINLGPAREEGRASLLLQIPSAREGLQIAFESPEESDGQPRVVLTSTCGIEIELLASGKHDVEIPLQENQSCELHLVPNYQLIDLSSFQRSTLTLEQLAWRPDP